jgi:hypothetical protein
MVLVKNNRNRNKLCQPGACYRYKSSMYFAKLLTEWSNGTSTTILSAKMEEKGMS